MFNIAILAIGKVKDRNLAAGIEEYLKRLRPYAAVKVEEIKPEPFGASDKEKAKRSEGERLMRALEKYAGDRIFLLSEWGEEFDSLGFSEKLEKESGRMVFVIAGALGFSEEIFKKHPKISLSKLTFPHELARLVLLEQIYRAAAIAKGKEYHY